MLHRPGGVPEAPGGAEGGEPGGAAAAEGGEGGAAAQLPGHEVLWRGQALQVHRRHIHDDGLSMGAG